MLRIFYVISTLFVFSYQAMAERYYTNSHRDQEPFILKTSIINETTLKVEFKLNFFDFTKEKIANYEFVHIKLNDSSLLDQRSLPALPILRRNILIPDGSEAEIYNLVINTQKMNIGPIAPSKGPIMRNINPNQIDYDLSFYQRGATSRMFPGRYAELGRKFILRKTQGIPLELFPFNLQSDKRTLLVADKIEFELRLSKRMNAPLIKLTNSSRAFDAIYKENYLNWPKTESFRDNTWQNRGNMLIITPSNYSEILKEFVQWKEMLGIKTNIGYIEEIGKDHKKIKEYIKQEYDKEPELTYVLLVGDHDQVPFFPGTAGNAYGQEADPMYGLLVGDDQYPEIIVARFSVADDIELQKMVTRSIQYDQNPTSGDWYTRAAGIASSEGNPTDAQRANKLKALLEASFYQSVDPIYEPEARSSLISDAINRGRSFVNYIGHGSEQSWVTGNFFNHHIDELSNQGMLPVIISVACVNGRFSYPEKSFAEAWTTAGTIDQPTGALAIFASSTNQSWIPPTVGQLKINELISRGSSESIGALMLNGSIAVLEDGSSTAVQTFQTWHIFGDPTIYLRNQEPTEISVDYPEHGSEWGWLKEIYVDDENLLVTIVKDGQLIAKEFSNLDGLVSFSDEVIESIRNNESGARFVLTISGINRVPYIMELDEIPEETFPDY